MKQQSPNLFGLLNREFEFDLDAAADKMNRKCELFIDEDMNALVAPWIYGEFARFIASCDFDDPDPMVCDFSILDHEGGPSPLSIFCNPPWSDPAPWLEKAYNEAQKSPNAVVVVILHQTWSAAVAPWLLKATEIRQLLNPRPMFKIPEGWYLCEAKTCKQNFHQPETWPRNGQSCPVCGHSKTTPQKNSSSSKDVQVIIYRRKARDTPPLIWLWDWKKALL